jgi:hypothetical protein
LGGRPSPFFCAGRLQIRIRQVLCGRPFLTATPSGAPATRGSKTRLQLCKKCSRPALVQLNVVLFSLFCGPRLRGLEPLTFGSVDRRSIQLSYRRNAFGCPAPCQSAGQHQHYTRPTQTSKDKAANHTASLMSFISVSLVQTKHRHNRLLFSLVLTGLLLALRFFGLGV